MSYDPACEELAEHFLGTLSRKELRQELAQHIQDEVERWIEYERDKRLKQLGWVEP